MALIRILLLRLREPSTMAGLGAILAAIGINIPEDIPSVRGEIPVGLVAEAESVIFDLSILGTSIVITPEPSPVSDILVTTFSPPIIYKPEPIPKGSS